MQDTYGWKLPRAFLCPVSSIFFAGCQASHLSSNSKVLTTRIFFSGALVGLYGADSSLPSLTNMARSRGVSGVGSLLRPDAMVR